MLGRRIGLMAVVAAMGLGAVAPGFSQPAPTVTASKRKKGLFNGKVAPSTRYSFGYLSKQRTTMAQQKRASRKARNVAKHKGRA